MLSLIFSIVIIYLIYYVWIVINFDKTGNPRKSKGKRGRPKNENKKRKMPAEIEFFVIKYKIDLNKVNYRYFLQLMGLVIAFDLGIIATIISYINELWLQLLVGFLLVIAIVLLSFKLLGNYFKKKGLTKDV